MKLGLTLVRVVVGVLFFGHGTQKLFGWFGGHGIEATAGFFESLGLRPGGATRPPPARPRRAAERARARVPAPAAAAVADRRDVDRDPEGAPEDRPLGHDGGYEYNLALIAVMVVLADLGPGDFAIDHSLGLEVKGRSWRLLALGAGVAGRTCASSVRRRPREPRRSRRGDRSGAGRRRCSSSRRRHRPQPTAATASSPVCASGPYYRRQLALRGSHAGAGRRCGPTAEARSTEKEISPMCGIVGYVGPRDARPLLLAGLEKLEYRGYDSAGISVLDGDRIDAVRAVGNLSALREAIDARPADAGRRRWRSPSARSPSTGIGHTRWATHGRVTEENAHPHFDTTDRVHIVVNGIVENYVALKDRLIADGRRVHLRDRRRGDRPPRRRTTTTATSSTPCAPAYAELRGHYAFVAMSADEPGLLVGARKECPLIIGRGDGEQFIASAIPAFLRETRQRPVHRRRRDRRRCGPRASSS